MKLLIVVITICIGAASAYNMDPDVRVIGNLRYPPNSSVLADKHYAFLGSEKIYFPEACGDEMFPQLIKFPRVCLKHREVFCFP